MTREIVIRIQVPDGVAVPDVDYRDSGEPPHPAAAAGSGPSCDHGPRNRKSGTNKSGKPYDGWFCADNICAPQWVSSR